MTTHILTRSTRKAKVHHKRLASNKKKSEIIKDVAAIMGNDLNLQQLADELKIELSRVYKHSRQVLNYDTKS